MDIKVEKYGVLYRVTAQQKNIKCTAISTEKWPAIATAINDVNKMTELYKKNEF